MANLEAEAAKRRRAVEWLNGLFPDFDLSVDASEEDLRARLLDGTVLCGVLRSINGCSLENGSGALRQSDNVKRFLLAVEEMCLPGFDERDLEQGSMAPVVDCLLCLRNSFDPDLGKDVEDTQVENQSIEKWNVQKENFVESVDASQDNNILGGRNTLCLWWKGRSLPDSKLQKTTWSPALSEQSTPLSRQVGHNYHDVFQLKQGGYSDLPVAKILEMMKSNSLDNAPTQSLLSVMNGILDESIEGKNGDIPHRVACLLRKVVQEIERRISRQAEHIRNQNNLIKVREEKYLSRIRVLETLATGTGDETQIVTDQLQTVKTEKEKVEEKKKLGEKDMERLRKEKENDDRIISDLKQELEMRNKTYQQCCQKLETEATETKTRLEKKIKEVELLLAESRKRTKELEAFSESKFKKWNKKEHVFQSFIAFQLESVQGLKMASESIKQQVCNTQKFWWGEINNLGQKLKVLVDAAENYHTVLAENRRLYNEVQELRGNIRVYCRIRPFLSGENKKLTTVNYIGENGELLVENPSKPGKDGHKMFKFNKVYGPSASQEEVFLDIQPLIRSVLDGYNVCIFAYGQTGSGKTYTMSGPNSPKENWGVNYRALNDLFDISRNRSSSFTYEVGVQMVEIYNEQVRDLLSNGGSQKKLGILNASQPSGLAVPDASMLRVNSTEDVLQLMQFGQANRATCSTALNERSSRSHSVLTVHVRGVDLKTGSTTRGCLHLVDLAGSERVDRSEVTGDRLKEAQHINKSLSALGDVIFALAQKSSHVPYRNSKLTQVLQSSLGGQAKTLMFVQITPRIESYSETVSTLKFAERVSGVQLGAARSNKEGKDVRDLMEQVACLKDTIVRKDEDIKHLQQVKDVESSNAIIERRRSKSLKLSSSSPRFLSGATQREHRLLAGRAIKPEKSTSDPDNCSEYSDRQSEASSQQSMDDNQYQKENSYQSGLEGGDTGNTAATDVDLLGFGDEDSEERLSDISDGGLSMGTETDGSSSVVELSLFPEGSEPSASITEKTHKAQSRIPKLLSWKSEPTTARSKVKDSLKSTGSRKNIAPQAAAPTRIPNRRL